MVSAHVGGHAGASPPVPLVFQTAVCTVVWNKVMGFAEGRAVGGLAECPAGLDGVTSQRARESVSHNSNEFCALGGNYLI